MFRAVARNLRHLFTATALLALLLVAAEIWLQTRADVTMARTVCPQASVEWQSLLVPSSTAHHELLRLQGPTESSGPANFSTNSLGLRGEEPAMPKPVGLYRVLILGDETVLGPDLPEKHTLAARLQEFLTGTTAKKVEVLNAGVPGYSPLLSLLQYGNELFKLQPDLIVLHFDMTDVADDIVHRRCLKESDGRQICINPLLSNPGNSQSNALSLLKKSAIWHSVAAQISNVSQSGNGRSSSTICRQYEWTTDSALDLRLQVRHAVDPVIRLAELAKQHHTQLVMSTSPVPWQVVSSDDFPVLSQQLRLNEHWPTSKDVPQQVLSALCSNLSISFCNATTAFRSARTSSKLFRTDAPHLSEFGTALYAREIAATLLKSPDVVQIMSRATTASAPTVNRQ
ncbi:MAG TPA: SGNH/GDSL hydrolase family protein [Planctomycetes bacterium]|nr:SGNH/GDSL hydrolase family protein [Fuerstiella sp.]HIK95441.1 SGNH/GDSL hydrolase family protein [Planctomycetota bacterium]